MSQRILNILGVLSLLFMAFVGAFMLYECVAGLLAEEIVALRPPGSVSPAKLLLLSETPTAYWGNIVMRLLFGGLTLFAGGFGLILGLASLEKPSDETTGTD